MHLLGIDSGQVVETGAPTRCPAGHELRAGTMLVGYNSPDPATHPRARTIECRAENRAKNMPGDIPAPCGALWFDGWGWRT